MEVATDFLSRSRRFGWRSAQSRDKSTRTRKGPVHARHTVADQRGLQTQLDTATNGSNNDARARCIPEAFI